MKRPYLFLLALIDGSNSVGPIKTKVRHQKDLLTQFKKRNPEIFVVHIVADDNIPEAVIDALGYKEAFFQGYSAEDTVSILLAIDEQKSPLDQILNNWPVEFKHLCLNLGSLLSIYK